MLAAVAFSVQILSLPAHSHTVLWPTSTQALMEPVLYRRPSTIALDSSGVAIVVQISEKDSRRSPQRVVIERDGVHVLPFPAVDELAPFFPDPTARNLMVVRNVVLSSSGEPVVALYTELAGAYWAVREASFKWNGSKWSPALPDTSGMMPQNVWVAAADSQGGFGYVGDYLYLDPASLVNARDDNLFNIAMTYRAPHATVLGDGNITAVSGNKSVGYDDGYVPGSNGSTPVEAMEWNGRKRSVLGAGIAWSVNARGDVVGDNRQTLKSVGVPILWRNGRSTRLSNAEGTAFAVADDGTIVGDVKSRGFLIHSNDANHSMIFLDDLVNGGWHIGAAYYVAANGNILALASKKGALSQLVLLRPIPPR